MGGVVGGEGQRGVAAFMCRDHAPRLPLTPPLLPPTLLLLLRPPSGSASWTRLRSGSASARQSWRPRHGRIARAPLPRPPPPAPALSCRRTCARGRVRAVAPRRPSGRRCATALPPRPQPAASSGRSGQELGGRRGRMTGSAAAPTARPCAGMSLSAAVLAAPTAPLCAARTDRLGSAAVPTARPPSAAPAAAGERPWSCRRGDRLTHALVRNVHVHVQSCCMHDHWIEANP